MRILHTSDWHLGQHFMGKSRQAEHQQLIDWLLIQVEEHAVDAVLIAGDIFDTGSPPSYARELYSQLVVRLHSAGVALLLLGGNHDSVATLGESERLLTSIGRYLVKQKDFTRALPYWQRLVTLAPGNADHEFQHSRCQDRILAAGRVPDLPVPPPQPKAIAIAASA